MHDVDLSAMELPGVGALLRLQRRQSESGQTQRDSLLRSLPVRQEKRGSRQRSSRLRGGRGKGKAEGSKGRSEGCEGGVHNERLRAKSQITKLAKPTSKGE